MVPTKLLQSAHSKLAAHHLNHPMFIPNRDGDSDEEVEASSKAKTASSQLIRELIRPSLTF